MDLLLTAATRPEIQPLIDHLQRNWLSKNDFYYTKGAQNIRLCISGAGSMATAYHVTKALTAHDCTLAMQAGIAGSFTPTLLPGMVTFVEEEIAADLGAEGPEGFLDLFELKLLEENAFPYRSRRLPCPLEQLPFRPDLPGVKAITVNTVSGTAPVIARRVEKYRPDIESMEGAAFHFVCLQEQVPFMQLRSVSNLVEVRDKSKWNIPLAIQTLNRYLIGLLEAL